jgi:hypothetical protein
MYLPARKLDAGAQSEKDYAEHLRRVNPAFDRTQVDLSPFQPLRAKIDFITIRRPPGGISHAEMAAMKTVMSGKLTRPNDQPNSLTIHDPARGDLQYLLANHPSDQVGAIEIAVDAYLPDGSNDLYLLRQLKEQIRHCIAPQMHKHFEKGERLYWDIPRTRNLPDAAANLAPLTRVKYKEPMHGMTLKVYVKTLDQGEQLSTPFFRTELRLDTPAWAGLDCIADLRTFADTLRTYCAPAFCIGSEFKSGDLSGKKWNSYGAVWELAASKGLGVVPNEPVNRAFGDALNELGRRLKRL